MLQWHPEAWDKSGIRVERCDVEEAGRRHRVVQIVGDGVDGDWLTWRWNDPYRPVGVHRVEGLREAVAAFRAALPRELAPGSRKNRSGPRRLATSRTVSLQDVLRRLGLSGPLTRRDDELKLMRALSRALLPDDLRCQLIEATAEGERVEVRVAPSPPAAVVPWGLLVLDDDDMRLLDIADVSWIAPILPRDIDPDAPEVTSATGGRALHIVDPRTSRGWVLSERFDPCDCHGHGAERFSAQGNGLEELRDFLDAGAGKIARMLMIGHCATGASDAADTVFLMGDGEANRLQASRLVREAGRWSMPPRVGVVACASGTDLTQHEPFGLGTALLINGAEVVHATLWPLPTDRAIGLVNARAVGAFGWLAQAVDHAQSDADPVASLCDLQRGKLAAWRERPGLGSSPLLWGAVITMTAPTGRRRSPGSTRIS